MPQRITAKLLASKDACREQRDIFVKEWPGGAEVTLENCRRASSLGLDLAWAAQRLLSPPAWQAYQEAEAPAWQAYQEAEASAWQAYQEADATAEKAYQEAVAPAEKAYQEAVAPTWKAYQEADAPAFYAAWLIDHSNNQDSPETESGETDRHDAE